MAKQAVAKLVASSAAARVAGVSTDTDCRDSVAAESQGWERRETAVAVMALDPMAREVAATAPAQAGWAVAAAMVPVSLEMVVAEATAPGALEAAMPEVAGRAVWVEARPAVEAGEARAAAVAVAAGEAVEVARGAVARVLVELEVDVVDPSAVAALAMAVAEMVEAATDTALVGSAVVEDPGWACWAMAVVERAEASRAREAAAAAPVQVGLVVAVAMALVGRVLGVEAATAQATAAAEEVDGPVLATTVDGMAAAAMAVAEAMETLHMSSRPRGGISGCLRTSHRIRRTTLAAVKEHKPLLPPIQAIVQAHTLPRIQAQVLPRIQAHTLPAVGERHAPAAEMAAAAAAQAAALVVSSPVQAYDSRQRERA